MPTVTTIGGWAAILAVAGTYYFVTKQRKTKNIRSIVPKQLVKGPESRKDTKSKKAKKDGALSSDQDTKQTQKKKTQQPATKTQEEQPVAKSTESKAERNEKNDDLEFARQLSNAKKGVVDAPKSQASSRTKSVKQTRAQEKPAGNTSDAGTAPSSTTGADGDDDQSPINSPELSATKGTSGVNGGVSDMLEKPADGPSVLRVTAPTNSQPKKEKAAPKFEVQETKKQKQNRKKAEEAKLAREEDEKARKVQLEAHRRSVREAEGRAAKDGSAFMASKAPTSSAWSATQDSNATKQVTNGTNGAAPKPVELLDTYEPTEGHVTVKPEEQIYSESQVAGSKLEQELSLIPEDEQMRLAKEDSSKWEEVKAKQPRKQKAPKDVPKENTEVKQDKTSSADKSTDFGNPPVIKPTGPGKKWDMTTVHVERSGNVVQREEEVQDSEWEVA